MAISITRYVDITSFVGAANAVPVRNFNARLFTNNPLVPTDSFVTFTSAAEVGQYFGFTSAEYLRVTLPPNYFGFISKNGTSAQSIDFARWTDVDSPPEIFGNVQPQMVSTYTAITSGSFGLTIGGVSNMFTGIDFSAVVSLAGVASVLQTTIRTATGTMWTNATVTYDAIRGSFDFTGGDAVDAGITVQEGTSGTHIAAIIGWLSGATLIISNGNLAETTVQTLTISAGASDNFGSFAFIPTLDLTTQIVPNAQWNEANNVEFLYSIPVTPANASAYSAALIGIGGCCVTLAPLTVEFPEQLPMQIQASTNYLGVNTVQNYMYQIANLTPSVTTDLDADFYDGLSINYYGQTQSAGQAVSFYQRGEMMGLPTDPPTIGIYTNEIWLKAAASNAIINLLLALPQLPANPQGIAMLIVTLQSVINQALLNGTISVGKILTVQQQLYITTITGDPNAWYQVQNLGYWLNCIIAPLNTNEYQAEYTLVYSKDDVINKVIGTHDLI
jgi:hypothetical protein